MNKQPLVSILINNYNYGRFLSEAIDSALHQTYPNVEIIVVDDGSSDESANVISSYKHKVTAILKKNGGQASAFNAGFEACHGEIICFLDADDIFRSHKVETIVKTLDQHSEVNWLFHSLEFFGNGSTSAEPKRDINFSGIYDLQPQIRQGKLGGCLPFNLSTATSGMCMRRSLLSKILPMPEEIRITSDDYIKYVALGISKGFISFQELALQRIHGSNAYTLRPEAGIIQAKTQVLTACNLKQNFPILYQFSDNLLSSGISLYWWTGGINPEGEKNINKYMNTLSLLEKARIYAKAFYYRHKR